MIIGVPKEIKNHEYRVGLTPDSVKELTKHGHKVLIETNAGAAIGFKDKDYIAVGASIAEDSAQVFATADMIVKVKEPQPQEYKMLRKDQILCTYLHLAADLPQTQGLIDSGCIAFAYETVTDHYGRLPLLAPMSEVAGRLAVQAGASALEKSKNGRGVLLGGVPGVMPAKVLVIGGGVVGSNSIKIAMGMGARVTVVDKSLDRLRELEHIFGSGLTTIYATHTNIEKELMDTDLVIGAVLVPGDKAPKIITREMLGLMPKGAVVVDVAVDQGGCFDTTKATTHDNPTYEVDGIIHYCVANMPGAVARTSTLALNNATLPYIVLLANYGVNAALSNKHLLNGLNVCRGKLTQEAVASVFKMSFKSPEEAIKQTSV